MAVCVTIPGAAAPSGPNIPPAIENVLGCCPQPQDLPSEMSLSLNGDGTAFAGSNCAFAPPGQRWLAPGDSASNYEVRYEHIEGVPLAGPGWVNAGSGLQFSVSVSGGANQRSRAMFKLYWREAGSTDETGSPFLYTEMQVTSGADCL